MDRQAQFFEACPHLVAPVSNLRAALPEQDEIVDVTNVAAHSQFLFHEMVKSVEVDIGQELALSDGSTARRVVRAQPKASALGIVAANCTGL
jgi:hypothetical protein